MMPQKTAERATGALWMFFSIGNGTRRLKAYLPGSVSAADLKRASRRAPKNCGVVSFGEVVWGRMTDEDDHIVCEAP
jgi:hypothetical protein